MAEKVLKCGIKKEKGYLYFIDKKGDISRAKMARGRKKSKKRKQFPKGVFGEVVLRRRLIFVLRTENDKAKGIGLGCFARRGSKVVKCS